MHLTANSFCMRYTVAVAMLLASVDKACCFTGSAPLCTSRQENYSEGKGCAAFEPYQQSGADAERPKPCTIAQHQPRYCKVTFRPCSSLLPSPCSLSPCLLFLQHNVFPPAVRPLDRQSAAQPSHPRRLWHHLKMSPCDSSNFVWQQSQIVVQSAKPVITTYASMSLVCRVGMSLGGIAHTARQEQGAESYPAFHFEASQASSIAVLYSSIV